MSAIIRFNIKHKTLEVYIMYFEAMVYYLITINIITFILYSIDKYNAIHGKWRIRELILLLSAFIGGPIGAILAMKIFRHKTKKAKFSFGVPIILLIHVFIIIYWTRG